MGRDIHATHDDKHGVVGVIAGRLSDRIGSRLLTVTGLFISGMAIFSLALLSYNFDYIWMGLIMTLYGVGYGLFNSPNISAAMSSIPASERGSASGMLNNMRNTGYVASMGVFFSILIAGLSNNLSSKISSALNAAGASSLSPYFIHMPPTVAIFGAFLGINPATAILNSLSKLPPSLSPSTVRLLESNLWFPGVLATPFMAALDTVFYVAGGITIIASIISIFRSRTHEKKQ